MTTMADRPLLVSLIGGITLIAAFIMIVIAVVSIYDASIITDFIGGEIDLSDWMGYGGLVVGIVTLIIGLAIWRGWSIAWYIAVILYILSIIGSIYTLYTLYSGGAEVAAMVTPLIPLVIAALIVYYLFRPKVKEFFTVGF